MNLPESTSAVEASNRFSFSTFPTFLFIRALLPYQKNKGISLTHTKACCGSFFGGHSKSNYFKYCYLRNIFFSEVIRNL